VEGSKKFSINEIQLPNAEEYGTETGGTEQFLFNISNQRAAVEH